MANNKMDAKSALKHGKHSGLIVLSSIGILVDFIFIIIIQFVATDLDVSVFASQVAILSLCSFALTVSGWVMLRKTIYSVTESSIFISTSILILMFIAGAFSLFNIVDLAIETHDCLTMDEDILDDNRRCQAAFDASNLNGLTNGACRNADFDSRFSGTCPNVVYGDNMPAVHAYFAFLWIREVFMFIFRTFIIVKHIQFIRGLQKLIPQEESDAIKSEALREYIEGLKNQDKNNSSSQSTLSIRQRVSTNGN